MTRAATQPDPYWQKLGIELPAHLAAEWRNLTATTGRGTGRIHATAAMLLWMELSESEREQVLAQLSGMLLTQQMIDSSKRRDALGKLPKARRG